MTTDPDPESTRNETERRILRAAVLVFSVKGRDGARMQEIADEAGINKAMLHYYFRTKNHLYEEAFRRIVDAFFGRVFRRLDAADTFEDVLRAVIDSYVQLGKKRPEVLRLLLLEHIHGAGTLGPRLRRLYDEPNTHTKMLASRVKQAMDAGEIRDGDPVQVTLTIASCCMSFFVVLPTATVVRPEIADDIDAFIDARKQHVFDVLSRGLR